MSVSSTNLFRKAVNLEISPQFDAYSGVRILTGLQDEDGNDIVYFAGNENGRVLEVSNAWGTQTQANNILGKIQGRSYKPYTADGAIIDPAAELNDGVTVNGVYSGICTKLTRFGTLMDADISAPQDQEIDHEYAFETSQERKFTRQVKEFKSELKIQASQISAKVSSSGGASSSFGWVLTDTDWSLYSNGNEIFKVTDSQMTFKVGGSTLLECGNLTGGGSGLRVNGLIEAQEFRTSSGQRLATSAELETIRNYSAGSYGGGSGAGFVGAMAAAQGFNRATLRNSGDYPNLFQAKHIDCGSISVANTAPFSASSGLMAAVQIMMGGMYHRNARNSINVSASGSSSHNSQGGYWVESDHDGTMHYVNIPTLSGSASVSGSTSNFEYVSWDDGN